MTLINSQTTRSMIDGEKQANKMFATIPKQKHISTNSFI